MRIPFSIADNGSMIVNYNDRLAFIEFFERMLANGVQPHVGIDEDKNELFIR